MKTNWFNVAALVPSAALLQAAILPLGLAPMAEAAPSAGQAAAMQRRAGVAGKAVQLFGRPGRGAARCANPRGVRVRVLGIFEVTNSDDGFKDNDVEVYGSVKFNGQPVFGISKGKAFTTRVYSNLDAGERSFDVIYNVPSTWKLNVDGFLFDYDKGSGNDAMWNPQNRTRTLNIKEMSQREARSNSYLWKGDRDSESADLKIIVSRMSYIY